MAVHESHRWRIGEPPPPIRAHSLVKHKALGEYLRRYVAALTQDPRVDKLTLTIIDGFAGGNVYTDAKSGDQRPGSPSIILDALKAARTEAQSRRTKPFVLDDYYIFVEKDTEAFHFLRETISTSEHGKRIGDTIQLVQGDFCDHVGKIIEFVRARAGGEHAILIMDQCGYSQVPFMSISSIFGSLKKAEVILTFAVGFLIDFLGVKYANGPAIRRVGLDIDMLTNIDKTDKNWKLRIQIDLRRDLEEKTGAPFSTPFFIRSKDSNRDLWLVHLSKHYKARDVMMEIHWENTNSFAHYGRPGLNMLGFDPDKALFESSQIWLPGFYFDDTAKDLAFDAILQELPKYMTDSKRDMVNVHTLLAEISNDTPATAAHIWEVCRQLAAEGEIEIRDKTGHTLRKRGPRSDSDVVYKARQMRLFKFGR